MDSETKNTWARDDPAILILIAACLTGTCLVLPLAHSPDVRAVSAIAWSVVYSYGVVQTVQLALLMIFRDYFLVGLVVATLLWCVLLGAQPARS